MLRSARLLIAAALLPIPAAAQWHLVDESCSGATLARDPAPPATPRNLVIRCGNKVQTLRLDGCWPAVASRDLASGKITIRCVDGAVHTLTP